jgi:hypothetical protein
MKILLAALFMALIAVVSPTAKAQTWAPPAPYCTLYASIDSFDAPSAWNVFSVGGLAYASIGANAQTRHPSNAAELHNGPYSPYGSFVQIDRTYDAQASYTSFLEDNCGGGPVNPKPVGTSAWCTVIAYVKPVGTGVSSGVLELRRTSGVYLTYTNFTLAQGGGWTYVQSSFIQNCPKDITVKLSVSGNYDAVIVDDVYVLRYD